MTFERLSSAKMRFIFLLLILCICTPTFPWGKTGHRVIGAIAEEYLSPATKRKLREIMGDETLAMASTWMDFIRSDPSWGYATPWHYCTIPDGMTWLEAEIPEEGDIIQTLERLIAELKTNQLSDEEKLTNVRFLIHLIGDLHQPLHVGNGEDRGGNDVKVKWFFQNSNLHRVWDSQMIDYQQMSYTEMAVAINHPGKAQIFKYLEGSVEDWAYESRSYRNQVYALPENDNLGYQYVYDNWSLVEQRLLQAGIRLAGVFNAIYG